MKKSTTYFRGILQNSVKQYRRLFGSGKNGILILEADTGRPVDINCFLLMSLGYLSDFAQMAKQSGAGHEER